MLNLPQAPAPISVADKEILVVTNADLRESANVTCWPTYEDYAQRLEKS
ncbi:hypothetical protein [Pseudovibrio sp. FO-BEG1]|nr:hypothetical protein [Pseudovibrio sp. FO-BEG1]